MIFENIMKEKETSVTCSLEIMICESFPWKLGEENNNYFNIECVTVKKRLFF